MVNIAGEIGVPAFGPFRATLDDGIYNISERNHMGLEGSWAPAFNNQKCLKIMKGMFENDIPVMFSYIWTMMILGIIWISLLIFMNCTG